MVIENRDDGEGLFAPLREESFPRSATAQKRQITGRE